MDARERDLRALVVLARWLTPPPPPSLARSSAALGMGLMAGAVAGPAEAEEAAIEKVESMSHPGSEVGWHVWLRIGELVETEHELPLLLETMQAKSILCTYEVRGGGGQERSSAAAPLCSGAREAR